MSDPNNPVDIDFLALFERAPALPVLRLGSA